MGQGIKAKETNYHHRDEIRKYETREKILSHSLDIRLSTNWCHTSKLFLLSG